MTRISREGCFIRMASIFAKRSTCERLSVGCVITSLNMERVLGIGWNGNYKGGPNRCDSKKIGECGCLHAEINALLKAGAIEKDKLVFCTDSPCVTCAKALINSGISRYYFSRVYRDMDGSELLLKNGVRVVHFPLILTDEE